MPSHSIAYVGLNLGPNSGADDIVVGVRVVPTGKEGNVVYARTLNANESDLGERITLQVGEHLVCPAGSLKVTIDDVERYAEPGPDGYAAVTNTVWTWLQIPPYSSNVFFNYMLAASRRLDQAHARYVSMLSQLYNRPDERFIKTRARTFDALGNAESMCNALNRAVNMMNDAPSKLGANTPVPVELNKIQTALVAIRNAFEHIDERAMGKARQEGQVDALSIFDQRDLVAKGVLKYAGYSLDLRVEVLPALMAGRKFIYDVIAESGTEKIINTEITFGPATGDSEESDPNFANACSNRGIANAEKGEYALAIQDLTKTIELDPNSANAYCGRGAAYLREGDFDSAIRDLTKAIELDPNSAIAYSNRGAAYFDKDDYERAIQDCTKAIELDPNSTNAYINLGNAHRGNGDADSAVRHYNRAIELDPHSASGYSNRGTAYLDKGDYDKAIQDCTKAIDLDPNFANAYNNRGASYWNKGDYEYAVCDYEKALAVDPKLAIAYFNRGESWLRVQDWEKAQSDFSIARNLGIDVVSTFTKDQGSVAVFEQKYTVNLPIPIVRMLTKSSDG